MSATIKGTIVVSGGNRGIGEDITHRYLNNGFKVVNISRQEPTFSHENLETYLGDLADRNVTQEIANEIVATNEVSMFVHNAGVIRPDLLEDVKLEDLDYLTQLHLGSAITLSQSFIPAMKKNRFGRIVLISSRGVLGLVTRTNYAATKAGQIGLIRTWALELGKDGITVNAVAPGPIETDMFHELVPEESEQKNKIAESIPVKRVGNAADVGRVVEFLCEPESSFITGQTWYVCGGASLGSLAL
ncbi:MAG: SDR family oxidoreductase [Gammaproteobacteria bacterium]|nr:SDR family oxidoreductase [Gammaproteobacteria bacterium]